MGPLIADPPMTGLLAQPQVAFLSARGGPAPRLGGLINTAQNYSFPMTSGLLGSLGSAPSGVPNYSQIALQMAGNPHAGPFSPVPVPSGAAAPGGGNPAAGSTSAGSGGGRVIGGLLGALAQNPNLLRSLGGLLGRGISALTGGSSAGSTYSGIGAPIDTSFLTSPSGYGDFSSFANSSGYDPVTGAYTPPSSDPYSLTSSAGLFGDSSGASSNPFGANYDATTGTFNSDPYSFDAITGGGGGFSSAGGQAAAPQPTGSAALGALNEANGLYGAYQGLSSGNPLGEAGGAIQAAQIANKSGLLGNSSAAAGALGAAGSALGAYGLAQHGDQNGGYIPAGMAAANAASIAAGDGAIAGLGPIGLVMGGVMAADSLLNGDEARSSAEGTYERNAASAQGNAYTRLTANAAPGAYLPLGNGGTSSAGWGYDLNQLNPDLGLSALIASKVTPLAGTFSYEPQKWAQTDPAQFYKTLQQMGPSGLKTYGITADALAAAGYSPQQIAALGAS